MNRLEALDAAPPAPWVVGAALLQALCLYALYEGSDAGGWAAGMPSLSMPLWTLALTVPTLFQLTIGIGDPRRLLVALAAFAVVAGGLGAYMGAQIEFVSGGGPPDFMIAYCLTMGLATVQTLLFMQLFSVGGAPDRLENYRLLMAATLRASQVPSLAAAFVAAFGALLALWAGLFSVIGIDFFADLFGEEAFLFPVLGLAFGIGVTLLRRLAARLGRIDALARNLVILLLPLALFVAAAFLTALPFTGLEALWGTGNGTALLLWLLLLILVFVNAVHQDGSDPSPYPAVLARALVPALLIPVVLAALAGYGLWLRIAQYGLSVDRFWALVVWGVLAACALAYAVLAARLRLRWMAGLGVVNLGLGAALLALMLLVNSPVLDPRKLTVASQLGRVASGEIAAADLDLRYFARALAAPGRAALERLRSTADEALVVEIDRLLAERFDADDRAIDWSRVRLLPDAFEIPAGVRTALEAQQWAARWPDDLWMVRTDLDRDGRDDFVLLVTIDEGLIAQAVVAVDEGYILRPAQVNHGLRGAKEIAAALAAGTPALVRPRFDTLEIGGIRIDVQ